MSAGNLTAMITAEPSLVIVHEGQVGSTNISWSTAGTGYSTAEVYVSANGEPEQLFARAANFTGSVAPWIQAGINYSFRLYAETSKAILIDTVLVRGVSSTFNNNARLRVMNGNLQLDGAPYASLGVNYYDAFNRVLENPHNTAYEAGFAALKQKGIQYVRLDVSGYWPIVFNLFWSDRAEYFRRLDALVASAEDNNIGLVPSLIWNHWALSDLAGEHVDQWAVENSQTRQMMREYVSAIVSRYANSPAIWAWEIGNEWNLAFDLPNASEFLPPIHPTLGTPSTRDAQRDIFPTDVARPGMIEFADIVRQIDPIRPISTGHATPRQSAWNQYHYLTWTTDTADQQEAIALYQTPDPFDMMSVHVYHDDYLRLQPFIDASASKKIVLFAGEFGDDEPDTSEFITRLEAIRANIPIGAIWNFDRLMIDPTWNITTTNSRSWMLDAMKKSWYPAVLPVAAPRQITRIEAEDYDQGSNGVAYYDTTAGNIGNQYRGGDVDIQACEEGGFNIAWTAGGEWLQYTVNVQEAGYYRLRARVASAHTSDKTYSVHVDGAHVAQTTFNTGGGGWQAWVDSLTDYFHLGAGIQTLRFHFNTDGVNLNRIQLEPAAVYANDFQDVAGTAASSSVPQLNTIPDFTAGSYLTATDGTGRLHATASNASANYRFKLNPTPLNQDASLVGIRAKIVMRAPTTEWVGISFGENGAGEVLHVNANATWLMIRPNWLSIRGGESAGGSVNSYWSTHAAGDILTLEYTYYFDKTVDLYLNGQPIAVGLPVNYINAATGQATDPVIQWAGISLRSQQTAANGGAYIESFDVELVPSTVLYANTFADAAGTAASNSVPESNSIPEFSTGSYLTATDGTGKLHATGVNASANYRFRINPTPLNNDLGLSAVRATIVMRAPATEWVGISFGENGAGVVTHVDANATWLMIRPNWLSIRGGEGGGGSVNSYWSTHAAGDILTLEYIYSFDKTVDLYLNGQPIAVNVPINYINAATGQAADPVISWAGITLRSQPTAANGGAYIDSLIIDVLP